MKILERVRRAFVRLVKCARLFPQTIAKAAQQRRQRTVSDEREAERLDRIRNPSKYRGKEI
jgi:hypothetical protein